MMNKTLIKSFITIQIAYSIVNPVLSFAVTNVSPTPALTIPTPPAMPTTVWTMPTPPQTPTQAIQPTATPQSVPTVTQISNTPIPTKTPKPTKTPTPIPTVVNSGQNNPDSQINGGQNNNDNLSGSALIDSGSIDGSINTNNDVNNNQSLFDGSNGGDTSVSNIQNEASSENNGSITGASDTTVDVLNQTDINNSVNVDYVTGDNKIHDNLGGSSTINSGDVTSAVNIFNFANTNLTGADISSSEFNVADDQSGDIILSAGSSNCSAINPCDGDASVNNDNNGSSSVNSGIIQSGNNLFITTDNFSQVDNSINIDVETGSNTISDSVGDSSINTGNANVVANIFNFLNNSFVALTDLVVNTVNILGDFAGNIVLPDQSPLKSADPSYAINNSGNGSNSINNGTISDSSNTLINQQNNATINNTLVIDANTGSNKLSDNINGDGQGNSITTGAVNTSAEVNTVANQNFIGDDLNVIFLNQGGQLKAYYINRAGDLVEISSDVNNSNNGTDSENAGVVNREDSTTINQVNEAVVNNTININANTGGNKIADNLDGSTSINTGDVNIVSSITNFLNNNFAGGRVVFTIVNDLFGKWTGKFTNKAQEVAHENNDNNTNNENIGNQQQVSVEVAVDSSSEVQAFPTPIALEVIGTTESSSNHPVLDNDAVKAPERNATGKNSSINGTSRKSIVSVLGASVKNDSNNDNSNTSDKLKVKRIAATSSTDDSSSDIQVAGARVEWPKLNPWKVGILISSLLVAGFFVIRKKFLLSI
ncbi:hypothetical protein HGA91_00700 [candidate division WWE3 bacterium]|nr:hypothetical protein [candidate division WWE3 bacterium]